MSELLNFLLAVAIILIAAKASGYFEFSFQQLALAIFAQKDRIGLG